MLLLRARNLKQLKNEGYIEQNIDPQKGGLIYQTTQKAIEELILEKLNGYVSHLVVGRMLDEYVKGNEEAHIEIFYKIQEFIPTFIKNNFGRTGISPKSLLQAFYKMYGEKDW
jgi:DNA-binding PadR family transcriptional regulator